MNTQTTPNIIPLFPAVMLLATILPNPTQAEPFNPQSSEAFNIRDSKGSRTSTNNAISPPGRPITPSSKKSGKRAAGSFSLWKTAGALLFVLVLIGLGAKSLSKHAPKFNGGIPPEALEILGKRNIDQRQAIHLVRLGSRILVIGNSPGGLQTLAEITDPVEVDYLAGMCRKDSTETSFTQGFLALFRREPIQNEHPEMTPSSPTNDIATNESEHVTSHSTSTMEESHA
ncbi:MAG: hypothetical protein Tsb009_02280 [Planctomycetaceae bacterium]